MLSGAYSPSEARNAGREAIAEATEAQKARDRPLSASVSDW
ncbi:hypothetical protein V1282_007010 [Nitrobacteraceae bacterium AZCC 2146]